MGMPQSNIDWSRYMEGLNGKMNKDFTNMSPGKDVVIEYKVNPDGSWYRKYKSGWLEQGGIVNNNTMDKDVLVNLIKPFKNNLYIVNLIGTRQGSNAFICSLTNAFTSTSFKYFLSYKYSSATTVIGIRWYACGQG